MTKMKLYVLLLLAVFIGFWQCAEPELETIKNVEDGVTFGVKPTKVSRINAATVAQNPRMTELMRKLQRKTIYKTVANQRTMTDSTAFKLQLTDIVMIEDQGYVSYTFGVMRDYDNGILENVIINVYPGGVIKTYFVEYDVTDSEREMIKNNIEVNLDGKTESFLIDDFEEVFSNPDALYLRIPRDFTLCPVVTTVYVSDTCPSTQHDANSADQCLHFNGTKNPPWTPTIYHTTYTISYVPCAGGGAIGGGTDGGGQTGDVPVVGNPSDGGGGGSPSGSQTVGDFENYNPNYPTNGNPEDLIKTIPVVPTRPPFVHPNELLFYNDYLASTPELRV